MSKFSQLIKSSKKNKKKNTIDADLRDDKKRLLDDKTRFDVKESYKELRTNVMFSLTGDNCKKIAITSSIAAEGKSTTCFNLAITFAETGAKILVIDCDLRRPNIGRLLNKTKEDGLSNTLIKPEILDNIIYKSPYDNLDVIFAGKIPPNPTELLSSKTMEDIIAKLSENYDYIFLDTPPIAAVTDAAVISKLVDGMIVVVRQGVAERPIIVDAMNKLEFVGAKIIGLVLNGVSVGSGNYGYYKKGYYKRGYYKRGYYRRNYYA